MEVRLTYKGAAEYPLKLQNFVFQAAQPAAIGPEAVSYVGGVPGAGVGCAEVLAGSWWLSTLHIATTSPQQAVNVRPAAWAPAFWSEAAAEGRAAPCSDAGQPACRGAPLPPARHDAGAPLPVRAPTDSLPSASGCSW